jgi:hypothetical protein
MRELYGRSAAMPETAQDIVAAIIVALVVGGLVWAILLAALYGCALIVTLFKRWRGNAR